MVDLLCIDYFDSGFKRYANDIFINLNQIIPGIKIAVAYMKQHKSTFVQYDFVFQYYHIQKYGFDADALLDECKPKVILLFAHRIFDYLFTIKAHKRGIKVLNLQHGLYMYNTVVSSLSLRNLIAILNNKSEQVRLYWRCLCFCTDQKIMKTLKFFSVMIRERSLYRTMNRFFGAICNADDSFVFGDYWKYYYLNQYLETSTKFHVVGYPEIEGETLEVSSAGIETNGRATICYLAQTSAEDGLVMRKTMLSFLKKLEELTTEYCIILKLHPRSDQSLYSALLNLPSNCVILWDNNLFPVTDAYIGHESTVVARALHITEKTMVCRLSNDRVSPFEKYTAYVSLPDNNLKVCVEDMMNNCKVKEKESMCDYIYHNKNGAMLDTSKVIANYLKEGSS